VRRHPYAVTPAPSPLRRHHCAIASCSNCTNSDSSSGWYLSRCNPQWLKAVFCTESASNLHRICSDLLTVTCTLRPILRLGALVQGCPAPVNLLFPGCSTERAVNPVVGRIKVWWVAQSVKDMVGGTIWGCVKDMVGGTIWGWHNLGRWHNLGGTIWAKSL